MRHFSAIALSFFVWNAGAQTELKSFDDTLGIGDSVRMILKRETDAFLKLTIQCENCDSLLRRMNRYPMSEIEIVGVVKKGVDSELDQYLAEKRAGMIYDWLLIRGIDSSRMTVNGRVLEDAEKMGAASVVVIRNVELDIRGEFEALSVDHIKQGTHLDGNFLYNPEVRRITRPDMEERMKKCDAFGALMRNYPEIEWWFGIATDENAIAQIRDRLLLDYGVMEDQLKNMELVGFSETEMNIHLSVKNVRMLPE